MAWQILPTRFDSSQPRRRLTRLLFLCPRSPHLWCPSSGALPGERPELAGLGQMLTLQQQLLPAVARNQGVAVLVNAMLEVLARQHKRWSTGSSAASWNAWLPHGVLVSIEHKRFIAQSISVDFSRRKSFPPMYFILKRRVLQ